MDKASIRKWGGDGVAVGSLFAGRRFPKGARPFGMDQVLIMQNIIIMFLVFLAVFLVIYAMGKKPVKRRQKIYACGEDIPPEHLNVPQDSFYRVFNRSLRAGWLKRIHTGNLSDYLAWIILGLVFLVIVLSILW